MDLDESVMGSLAQWFQTDRGQCGLDGVGVMAGCAQSPGKTLQCMQPRLAQRFSRVLHPVVIPVRQQIASQVGQAQRIQLNGFGRGPRPVEPAGEGGHIMHINFDAVIQPKESWGGSDYPLFGLVDPP